MIKILIQRYFIPFLFIFGFLIKSNIGIAQVSTVGKEFWIGFMENNRVPPNQNQAGALDLGIVVITASEPTTGTISYPGSTVNFNLQVGQQFVHRIENFDAIHRNSGIIENKSVYIISSGNVSVYAFNERERSADGTVVLPISALGKDHYITSHFEIVTSGFNPNVFNTNNESLLLVVAVEDNTQIEITPSVNPIQNPTLDPIYITLNAGQSYQLKARGDLTGSRVRVVGEDASNCKNIAVFGGNKWTGVGNCGQANDHLFQQAYPVNTWGNEFFHVPLAGRNSGELVKILASEPDTEIIVNSVKLNDIGAGEFITMDFSHTQSAYITSNKPISVTGFAKSMDCNRAGPGSDLGDPFMVGYSPNQQLLKEVSFVALQLPLIDFHYVNIVTKTASVQNTFLDGQNVGNQFTPFPSNSAFSFARIQINQGVHRLENSDGFIGYVYGFGDLESYGFAVGASLENLNFEVEQEYDFDVEGDLVACLDSDAVWVINPENDIFTYFTWDFGDGSEIMVGKEVVHKYQAPGTYDILVTASISPESCDQQEEIRLEVVVEEFSGEIKGPVSVCPDIEDIEYVFDIEKEYSKIEWVVEGGVILDEIDNLVTIRWLGANNSAKLFALPFNKEGCPGEMVELNIIVNNRLDPDAPSGVEQVCFDGNTLYEYSVAEVVNGRGYEWFVTEGEIVGSNENSVVQVNWSSAGVTGKIWYREFSLINDDCEGMSPELDVIVTNEFNAVVEESVGILCYGEETGRISLNVFGGQAPYTYTWSHDQSLNAQQAEDIPAGVYAVTITDALGCEIPIENINISEPALLEIVNINTTPTSCFGRNDGEAVIEIQGGVAPYLINFESFIQDGNQIALFDLEGRFYELEVTDANGCLLPVKFNIDAPLPLEVDVRIEKFACPGESNGELIAEPQSLNAPYTFIWGFDNSDQFTLQGVPRGDYDVTVVDDRGCISFGKGEMLEADPIARMPTGFNPKDGVFEAVANCEDLNYELMVYTRWGELIYKGVSGWDGKINQEDAPLGTYSYMFSYNYILNGEPKNKQISGSFILIR